MNDARVLNDVRIVLLSVEHLRQTLAYSVNIVDTQAVLASAL